MSGSSSTESSRTSTELDCEICNTAFDASTHCPRILTKCGHTICEECAGKLWVQGERREVKCPFDRINTYVRGSIKFLPKNFTLQKLVDSRKIAVPKILKPKCSKNALHEAWFTCEECEADFCESCFDSSHFWSKASHHKKIPTIDNSVRIPKCKKHPSNFADFVCQDSSCEVEDKLICTVCWLNEHDGHQTRSFRKVVFENEKQLKEELIKKPVLKETEPFLSYYCKSVKESYKKDTFEYDKQLKLINEFYEKQRLEAVRKFEEYAEMKLEMAEKVFEEHEKAMEQKNKLDGVRNEIRGRLNEKTKLWDVEDLLTKHKETHEELNRKRDDCPKVSSLHDVCFKFPSEMEIIDPDQRGEQDVLADISLEKDCNGIKLLGLRHV